MAIVNNLTTRYLISFGLLAVLIIGGLAWSEYQLATQERDSRVVNISGRQRMLSQKISKVVAELAAKPDAEMSARLTIELEDAIHLWERSQNALRFGDESLGITEGDSPAIGRMYENLNPVYERILNSGKTIVTLMKSDGVGSAEFSQAASEILSDENSFLTSMNNIVFAHDSEALARVTKSRIIVLFVDMSLLLFMIFLWFVAIRPALRKAEATDKAKTEFVSLASHQLRTPLTAISWYTEMILRGDMGKVLPEQRKYLEEIYGGDQRMIKLVNTLLDVSRLELGTFTVRPEPIQLKDVAESVLAELHPQIIVQKITLDKHYDSNLPVIPADPQLIRMIFQNLLSNAIKYASVNSKIRFDISIQGPNALIKVWNNGAEIPKEAQPKIFTKFFRDDLARQKDSDGNGLGLYIVKSIVENSGGKIWFESAENKGTTFYVTLPLDGMKKSPKVDPPPAGKEVLHK